MDKIKIPYHIGIIVDGNGRWAKEKGLSRSMGHLEGSKTLRRISLYAFEKGVKVLSAFVFSTENFKRSKEEVDYLMNLFVKEFGTNFKIFKEKNIKVVFSGEKKGLPNDVQKVIAKMEQETINNDAGIFNVCINYGGRKEIVETSKKLAQMVVDEKIKKEDISEELFKKNLYYDLPDIDLLIRTSGEIRLSNFMLYQLSYAELYFPKTYFPDFLEKEFDLALEEYTKRDRRYGGINYEK